jgi:phage major head subunit gpT-like protein
MSAPAFIRSNYSDLFGSGMLPVLEELFRSEIAMHPGIRERIFKQVRTDRDIWQYSELHDMPLFSQMAESEDYSFQRPKQGNNKTLSIVKYGLGFSISEESVEDGRFDFIADAIRKMARSAMESKEVSGMNILNNGFDSGTSADGQFVFDTDHSLPSGLTYRNRPSTMADLSQSSLDSALTDFETQFVGDSGIIERIQPKILLVHSSQKRYAKELVGSDLKPDSADNNINSLKDEGLVVVSSPHLSDTDSWFLLASPEETGLRIAVRKDVETKAAGEAEGFINDSIYYKSRYREALGVMHAKGIWGSSGA